MAKIPLTKVYPQPPPVPSTGTLGHKFAETLARGITRIRDLFTEWLEDRLINFAIDILERLEKDIAPWLRPIILQVRNFPHTPNEIKPLLDQLAYPTAQGAGAILGGLATQTASAGLGTILNAALAGPGYDANRYWRPARLDLQSALVLNYRYPDLQSLTYSDLQDLGLTDERIQALYRLVRTFPDLNTLLELTRRGEISTTYLTELLRLQGHTVDDAKLVAKLTRVLPDINTIRQLYLRGEITAAEHNNRLRQLGIADEDIAHIVSLYQIIPPVQDIITMAVREVFDPEQVRSLALDSDFPREFGEWARKQGLSDFWAHKYWQAHWQLPSPQMGFEMYHRGIISRDELRNLLKALDYSPAWRDKLMALSHTPYTRVDIRRMYQLGILSAEDVYRSYKDIGYDDEHAQNLTAFTVLGASQEEKDLTKADIINGYKDGMLFREDAAQMLMNLGYDSNEAEFYLIRAEIDIAKEERKERTEEIHSLYIKRVIDETNARIQLSQASVPGYEIEKLLNKWNREISASVTILSRSDIEKLYKRALISRGQTERELARLDYQADDIAKIMTLWDYELAKELEEERRVVYRTFSNTEVQKLLWQGIITEKKAKELLEERNYSAEAIDYMIRSWRLSFEEREAEEAEAEARKIEAKVRHPSNSEIKSLYVNEIIDSERAVELLLRRGVTGDVVAEFMQLWNREIAEIKREEEERKEKALDIRPKMLTSSQAHSLYISEIINDNEAIQILSDLGYAEEDILRLMTLWSNELKELKENEEARKKRIESPPPRLLTRTQLKPLYLAEIITVEQAVAALRQLNYSDDTIALTIEEWNLAKEK